MSFGRDSRVEQFMLGKMDGGECKTVGREEIQVVCRLDDYTGFKQVARF
jgi:hypothetical protein